jgi:hypothetical protein
VPRLQVDPAALLAARDGILRGSEPLFAGAYRTRFSGPDGSRTAEALRDLAGTTDGALDGAASAVRGLAALLAAAADGYRSAEDGAAR